MSALTTKDYLVIKLNKLLSLDRDLVEKLVDNRVVVNEAYIQSEEFTYMQDADSEPVTGLIGVLNGLLVQDEYRIAAVYDDNMKLTKFEVIRYNNEL